VLTADTHSHEFQEYKTLLNKVSRKIDKWHEKITVPDTKKGHFSNDGDYVEADNSPSKFESSSDDEEKEGYGDRHHRRPKNIGNMFEGNDNLRPSKSGDF
jgi:hypothetical protein